MSKEETRLEDLKQSEAIRIRNVPPFLYKYRSWDDEKHQDMLKSQIVWFASPASFNDPFDCKIPYLDILTLNSNDFEM